ncbi:glycoside hydrolase family 73 protein [Clostridium botulinum]|uniref:Mannosyl-glycoprotein endo-beta-N-acetylglucosaminidase domain protein n=1 Tax=Clostridium botulinum (strain Langeland / NCTC 10281 / Type F) TaxID=441772 RepID=A7GE28_CLOBL|nr:glucosaminidase domain-containing protein [Clostridium botulinum]ABS42849.1 mannosyl-glycoprotein endo-beta-N-acetylglucosaminidase domain protein [Clostridium botulinum F str. Langeland]KKM42962.1 mannosyl-glycoprotein endo-beta-N-acetylglucosamidase [Clostridium botulinum]MBY6791524.1 glucosaminidase domain-containing protein [Clostridium botulinum]MBY6936757.1 glucosaminidase domain-containing protein [Clostridium botulinum]MBY6944179.1 glucosaminidase domain-containing protein [Clostrid
MKKATGLILKLMILVLLAFTIFIMFNSLILNKKNERFLPENAMNIYIKAADEVSENKLQVNWKYIAALDGVKNKKDFSKANIENSKVLGKKFLEISKSTKFKNTNYRLLTLDEVISKMSFTEEEKKNVHKYLDKLNNIYPITPDEYKRQFIDELIPISKELYDEYGILPSVTIGQAILESDWGRSELSKKGNNLFGIKATPSWQGKVLNMETSENYNDKIKDNFRYYSSKEDSIKDYANFLVKNKRYRENKVFRATEYKTQAKAIEKAGYSTKKDKDGNLLYSSLLGKIIREYNLQLIDSKTQEEISKK